MRTASTRLAARWNLTHRRGIDGRQGQVLIRGRDARNILTKYGFKPLTSAHGLVVDDHYLPDLAAVASIAVTSYALRHEDGTDCECGVPLRHDGRRIDLDPTEDGVS